MLFRSPSKLLTGLLVALSLFAVSTTLVPAPVFAAGLVPCATPSAENPKGAPLINGKQACDFTQIIKLIDTILSFLIVIVAPMIATCIFLYGGFLILTSAGNVEKVSQAKGMFTKALMGLVIAMCGWLIVQFILVHIGINEDVFPTFY